MKLVKFGDGTYGVRSYWFFGWHFISLTGSFVRWWNNESIQSFCKGTQSECQRIMGCATIKHKTVDIPEKQPAFYKKFYDENRVKLLQYDSLRKNFQKMIDDVLGTNYYNMAMDVYEADRICCEDITLKAKSFFRRLF